MNVVIGEQQGSIAEKGAATLLPFETEKLGSEVAVPATPSLEEIRGAARLLFGSDQNVEVRALGGRPYTKCFTDLNQLVQMTLELAADPKRSGVYWTLQEVDPTFSGSVKDANVIGYRWLLVDADPVRHPSKISSTENEKASAYETILSVREYLISIGVTSILADSGNGFHLLCRIDLPANQSGIVHRVLQALAAKFDNGAVKIDTTVYNPSRINKVYGSVARKGKNLSERPHRMARILDVPQSLPVVSRALLELIAVPRKESQAEIVSEIRSTAITSLSEAKVKRLEQLLVEANIGHGERMEYANGWKWQIDCPFNIDHRSPDAFVYIVNDGAMGFKCSHNSCATQKWPNFRAHCEGVIGHRFAFADVTSGMEVSVEATVEAPTEHAIKIYQVQDMPETVLDGKLGEIFQSKFSQHFPRAYGWLALVTHAGILVPPIPPYIDDFGKTISGENRTNLYTALVGEVHSGKTQASRWSQAALGLPKTLFSRIKSGSPEGLFKMLADEKVSDRHLIDIDEWSHFFSKASIEGSTFSSNLSSGFYDADYSLVIAGGKRVKLNCSLSWIGGIVERQFDECFSSVTVGGLYDRFIFGHCPTGYSFDYRPYEGSSESLTFTPVRIDESVWEVRSEWLKQFPGVGREMEIAIRVAHICASADGRSVLTGDMLAPAKALLENQVSVRKVLRPNVGDNPVAKCQNLILNWLSKHCPNGEEVNVRDIKRGLSYQRLKMGSEIWDRAVQGLARGEDVISRSTTPDNGGPKSQFLRLSAPVC